MKRADEMPNEFDLEGLFMAARATAPAPSTDLMSRILADAAEAQPRPAIRVRSAPEPRRSWLGQIALIFGGGGALAGMSLAAVAGVFVGIAQPGSVQALTTVLLSGSQSDGVDLLPQPGTFWGDD